MAGAPKGNQNARRPDQSQVSSEVFQVRCTKAEKASYHALARYLVLTPAELVRTLFKEKRAALVAEGKRPPRR